MTEEDNSTHREEIHRGLKNACREYADRNMGVNEETFKQRTLELLIQLQVLSQEIMRTLVL